MPKPVKFSYEKKSPFRDAFFFIIVCEGQNREPEYFHFFEGMSSRVKIIPVKSKGGSAPNHLIDLAIKAEQELSVDPSIDKLWFVIDTDRWGHQLHAIRNECATHPNWKVAESNPCFEVWLYFHAKTQLPALPHIHQCNNWKPLLPTVIKGGFNSDFHPIAIETAIENSKAAYQPNGYFPNPGSTQLWALGEELVPLIKKELEDLKSKFPVPEVIG
jgi:hypothetical protein